MPDPAELELVRRAVLEARTTGGCCEWDIQAARRVRDDPNLEGFTADGIRQSLIAFVEAGGEIFQVPESRPEYNYRGYYYKVILPVPEFPDGLFVEIVLIEEDPELPGVLLVNAHEQRR